MFSQVALVIELAGLQIGVCRSDIGKGGLVHDVSGDILDRGIGNLMDEADVLVFAGRDPGDNLTPCDFEIDDGLAAAAAVIDHHNKILHADDLAPSPDAGIG